MTSTKSTRAVNDRTGSLAQRKKRMGNIWKQGESGTPKARETNRTSSTAIFESVPPTETSENACTQCIGAATNGRELLALRRDDLMKITVLGIWSS